MKLLCLSDLHLRDRALTSAFRFSSFSDFFRQIFDAVDHANPDAIVVTGDTVTPDKVELLPDVCKLLFPAGIPIILTLGNHEFWGHHFHETLSILKSTIGQNKDVFPLDIIGNVELGGVNFVGGTLFFDGSMRFREDQKYDEWDGWQDWLFLDIDQYREINQYYVDMIRSKMKPGIPTALCTHHVPHELLNGHGANHYSFYSGVKDLVHNLPFDPKFSNYLICGHTHKRVIGEVIPGFMGVNVGSDYDNLQSFVLEV